MAQERTPRVGEKRRLGRLRTVTTSPLIRVSCMMSEVHSWQVASLKFKAARANSWFVGMATVEVAREDIIKRRTDAINRRDTSAVAALYAPDAVSYAPITPEGLRGRDAIRKSGETFLKAFPDINQRLLNINAKGDTVAAEWVATGRHSVALELPTGTLAPTNRQITVRGATFYRFDREGLISEERSYFDMASFLQQLGLKP